MNKNQHPSQFMSLLEAKNKTPEQVAEALDVSLRAVYYWVSGQREPRLTITQVQALCTLLDCSVHDIPRQFGRADIPEGDAIN
jgi:transcriptional regulator with XRE-family HTH domain